MDVTVTISTRDRVDYLRRAAPTVLASIAASGRPCELLIVDNGSIDGTSKYLEDLTAGDDRVRTVVEATPGASSARNRAIREAQGDVLLFTDDDLEHPSSWVRAMTEPILMGDADAVAGKVVIASELRRAWFTDRHRYLLAESVDLHQNPVNLISASMAVRRSVAAEIGFEEEIGAGRLGAGEDVLFSLRVRRAGHRVIRQDTAASVHHFDPRRLEPNSIRRHMASVGRSEAWLDRHWSHSRGKSPRLKALAAAAAVQMHRARPSSLTPSEDELAWIYRRAYNQQMLIERKQAPRY